MSKVALGIRAAQAGLLVNVALVIVKFLAGVIGNTYALVADAVESSTDIFSSLVVWGGLRVTTRSPDENHPFGYGKAEPLAAAAVALMLLAAGLGIGAAAIREIMTPHAVPASWTLVVAGAIVIIKEVLFRRVLDVGHETGSTAVRADAWHHRADAITSAAAFTGIAIAIWGGPGWEAADDWAALAASALIVWNGVRLMKPAIHDLMDRAPGPDVLRQIEAAARSVEGVCDIEKLRVRKFGMDYSADLHVQADPAMSLHEAHILGGRVKGAIKSVAPAVSDVLVHMEPHEPTTEAHEPGPAGIRAHSKGAD
ncbi:MAG TPA: cation diffusion facilitator family transporter [Planctomycetia bacterium]|nr:cation diffusion facilitator family transporter [Planctomycetia bacterium]